jgi:hypothetical protein
MTPSSLGLKPSVEGILKMAYRTMRESVREISSTVTAYFEVVS